MLGAICAFAPYFSVDSMLRFSFWLGAAVLHLSCPFLFRVKSRIRDRAKADGGRSNAPWVARKVLKSSARAELRARVNRPRKSTVPQADLRYIKGCAFGAKYSAMNGRRTAKIL